MQFPSAAQHAFLDSRILLIRHGLSLYNAAETQDKREEAKTDIAMMNCDLHPTGVQQAHEAANILKHLDIEVVLVSPLKRALRTCFEAMKGHPNRSAIKFVVYPEIQERLGDLSSLDLRPEESMREFGKLFGESKSWASNFRRDAHQLREG